jgi:hypothetical protein
MNVHELKATIYFDIRESYNDVRIYTKCKIELCYEQKKILLRRGDSSLLVIGFKLQWSIYTT